MNTLHATHAPSGRRAAAGGLATFAAVMLVIGGVLDALRGISAIFKDNIFVTTPDYVYKFDVSGWGWIHLILGILAVLIGFGLFRFTLWARLAGILIAGLLVITSFLSLPYYPLWSIVLIALYGFVIWALCVVRKERA